MALLAELEAGGSAGRVRPVWIAGAVAFEGTPAAVRAVALLPEVLRLGWDAPRPLAEIEDAPAACPAPPGVPGPTPNLVEVQAPQLWALGMTGQGIRILNIDGGTDVTHPDLAGSVWTNPFDPLDGVDNDGNGYVDDLHGWDFVDGDNNPSPAGFDAHGTNTAGILVGDGTSSGSPTGMAPDAELAVARVNTEVDHWLALQYAVGTAMDCTSSSYSYKWGTFPKPDYHTHRDVQVVLLAAGIIHVNSIGNQGGAPEHPVPFQIAVPGSVPGPWRHPIQAQLFPGLSAALGCGAVELGGGQYSLSSLGPSAWEDVKLYSPSYGFLQNPAYWDYPVGGFVGDQQGLIKPDLVAPTNVQTTAPGGGYSTFGGTSAATPHLGGACALLRSASPAAEPRHLAQALQITAFDLGPPGKDVQFGAGELRVRDAALRLLHLVKVDDVAPQLGDPVTVLVYGTPGATFATLWGLDQGTTIGPGFALDLAAPFHLLFGGVLNGAGQAGLIFNVPGTTALVGVEILLQSVQAGAGGVILVSTLESLEVQG
jgi:subtilisin family serine protease